MLNPLWKMGWGPPGSQKALTAENAEKGSKVAEKISDSD